MHVTVQTRDDKAPHEYLWSFVSDFENKDMGLNKASRILRLQV